MTQKYRFTFGPWNISTGADPFGPPVRPDLSFAVKLREYKKLGFDGVQLHDDDVCPADWNVEQTRRGCAELRKVFDDDRRRLYGEFRGGSPLCARSFEAGY
jgi:xylose isomerase